jgi:hypothetical protein
MDYVKTMPIGKGMSHWAANEGTARTSRLRPHYMLLLSLQVVLIAGCAEGPHAREELGWDRAGSVGAGEVTDELQTDNRLVLSENELFFPAEEDEKNAMPSYPPELLSRAIPSRTVCIRIAIDDRGNVSDAAPVVELPDCPETLGVEREYLESATQAVSRWKFVPAFRCVFPDAKSKDTLFENCGMERPVDARVKSIPQPISLVYRFSFIQKEGRGVVDVAR